MNTDEKRRRTVEALRLFITRYNRTSRRGGLDPNDRNYERETERYVKRIKPEQLDALLRDGESE